jgi:hypothetical protein
VRFHVFFIQKKEGLKEYFIFLKHAVDDYGVFLFLHLWLNFQNVLKFLSHVLFQGRESQFSKLVRLIERPYASSAIAFSFIFFLLFLFLVKAVLKILFLRLFEVHENLDLLFCNLFCCCFYFKVRSNSNI